MINVCKTFKQLINTEEIVIKSLQSNVSKKVFQVFQKSLKIKKKIIQLFDTTYRPTRTIETNEWQL